MNSVKISNLILVTGGTIAIYHLLRRFAHSWSASPLRAKRGYSKDLPPLDSSQQSPRQSEGVSLCQVYPPPGVETETDIDIIAIHGLDTKSPDTWTWVDPSNHTIRVNWLEKSTMLPSKVERVRIFTCDWPAGLLQRTDLVQKKIEELALLLFETIQNRPLAKNEYVRREDRPILFIASCLGGIVLMKALVETGEEYDSLRAATRGIIFLATPFRGTAFRDVAAWAEPGLRVWASILGQEVNNLVDSVKGSTFDLEALVFKFVKQCEKQDPPRHVFNFYELGKTSLSHKVLPWIPNWPHQEKQVRLIRHYATPTLLSRSMFVGQMLLIMVSL